MIQKLFCKRYYRAFSSWILPLHLSNTVGIVATPMYNLLISEIKGLSLKVSVTLKWDVQEQDRHAPERDETQRAYSH